MRRMAYGSNHGLCICKQILCRHMPPFNVQGDIRKVVQDVLERHNWKDEHGDM